MSELTSLLERILIFEVAQAMFLFFIFMVFMFVVFAIIEES